MSRKIGYAFLILLLGLTGLGPVGFAGATSLPQSGFPALESPARAASILRIAASPLQDGLSMEQEAPPCYLLDDPAIRSRMSAAFELALLQDCGRWVSAEAYAMEEISLPNAIQQGGPDVRVNAIDPQAFSTTQSETSIAINRNTGTVCANWNDSYHYLVQNLSYIGFANSTDGGQSFNDTETNYLPEGGGGKARGDPSVVWRAADGYFYATSIHLGAGQGLGFWRSTDDCTTFQWLAMSHSGSGDDKELLAVDNNPTSPYYGRFYIAWTDYGFGARIRLVYSDDGVNWSSPVNLSSAGASVQGAWPVVAPNGDVYVAWVRWLSSDIMSMEVVRSTNGGTSFSFVTNPASNVTVPRDAVATSACGRAALNGNIRYLPSPQIAAGPDGCIHVVYPYDPDGYNVGDVVNSYYRRSCDNGATWGPEILLNDDGGLTDQFFPALTVNENNVVAASWYDRRLDPGSNWYFDRYMAVSYDGGITWEANERVSDVSSPVYIDPSMSMCYHGDYDQMASDASSIYVLWSDDRVFFNGHYDPDLWLERHTLALSPTIVVEPTALTTTLHPDEQAVQTLWVTNTGGEALTFTVHEMSRTVRPVRPVRSDAPVDPQLWTQLESQPSTRVLIYLRELADLSLAYAIQDWEARGRFVYERLKETADRSGGDILAWLDKQGAAPRQLLATNAIAATVDAAVLAEIAGRPEVARVGANVRPVRSLRPDRSERPDAVEWNIAQIRADEVWSTLGINGSGVVVGDIDTGVLYTHPALVEQYRGNLGGGSYDHNYNWFDFDAGLTEPYDDNGHGTFGTGIMVGDDGGNNQIGVAPGAEWIAVRVDFSYEDLHAAQDWMLAPTDLNGQNPDPAKRPHVGLNPWNGPGCDTEFQPDHQAWRAAGILPISRLGSNGPTCASTGSPGDLPEAFTATATDVNDDGNFSSSRGPSCWGETKPEVAAPGINVRSSNESGGYEVGTGTSWSAAHLAGAAALVYSADPSLDSHQVEFLLTTTAVPLLDSSCGPAGPPNNVYGWGRIDAFEAVSLALGGVSYDIPWLSEEPVSGTLGPGEGIPITVTFDSTGLAPAVYQGLLDVESNDPNNPHVSVLVTLTVVTPCVPVTATAFTWQPLTPVAGAVVTFTASASGTEPIAYIWAFGNGDFEFGNPLTQVYTLAGAYTVTLTATNECGVEVVTHTVTVLPPCEPVAILSVTTAISGCEVTFGAELTGTESFDWLWDFGAFGSRVEPTPTVDFVADGVYPYTLTVGNCADAYSATYSSAVTVSCPPPCDPVTETAFSWLPLTPTAGQPVTFTGSATGTAPIDYAWDWGDGMTGTGIIATHVFTPAGAYTVTLTATNECGEDSAHYILTVLGLPPDEYDIYLPIIAKNYGP
jgi:PKD repeat protein/subtilisin family serine protease